MTTATITTRACDRCGQVTDYEPIKFAGWDLGNVLPHYCADCATDIHTAEEAVAAAARRDRREREWLSTVPKKYRDTSLTHDSFPRKLWNGLQNWPLERNIGLIGAAGRGKTRLLALLTRRVIAGDGFAAWCPLTSFQWAAQNQWDDRQGTEAKQWLRKWQDCAVLFLDDLGKHRWTEAVESEFFALVDLRSSRGLPMHWTMNPLPADEAMLVEALREDPAAVIGRALDPSGAASARPRFAPIVSRLIDGTEIIPVL